MINASYKSFVSKDMIHVMLPYQINKKWKTSWKTSFYCLKVMSLFTLRTPASHLWKRNNRKKLVKKISLCFYNICTIWVRAFHLHYLSSYFPLPKSDRPACCLWDSTLNLAARFEASTHDRLRSIYVSWVQYLEFFQIAQA